MSELLTILAVVGPLVLLPAAFVLAGRRARRRGVDGSLLAPLQEAFDPASHRSHVEVQAQAERRSPGPALGDPPAGR